MVADMSKRLPKTIFKADLATVLGYAKTREMKKLKLWEVLKLTEEEYDKIKRFSPLQTKLLIEHFHLTIDDF